MIHYHGTPLTPRASLEKLKGHCFCVSYAQPQDTKWCMENAQSVMWDNGAFSAYTRGKIFDKEGYINWLDDKLWAANWAVIPDVISGDVETQKDYIIGWPYPKHLSAPVWHMHLPIDWLIQLVNEYPRVCFGSSGEYWKVGNKDWSERADEAWEAIDKTGTRPMIHMMRGLKLSSRHWPFASADSTNIARNYHNKKRPKCPKDMATAIDSIQPPLMWRFTDNA